MSLLRGIKESRKVEDLNKLKVLIVKFEKHLRSTNEKLANLRNLIRTESNVKTRKTHLKKSHTLVWEQHTLRNILIDYRKKLEILDAKVSMILGKVAYLIIINLLINNSKQRKNNKLNYLQRIKNCSNYSMMWNQRLIKYLLNNIPTYNKVYLFSEYDDREHQV